MNFDTGGLVGEKIPLQIFDNATGWCGFVSTDQGYQSAAAWNPSGNGKDGGTVALTAALIARLGFNLTLNLASRAGQQLRVQVFDNSAAGSGFVSFDHVHMGGVRRKRARQSTRHGCPVLGRITEVRLAGAASGPGQKASEQPPPAQRSWRP